MSGWARELVGGAKATLLAVGAKSSALAGGGWRVGVLVAKDLAHCCMLHQIESHRIASHRIASLLAFAPRRGKLELGATRANSSSDV